jgi:hypothetical protein
MGVPIDRGIAWRIQLLPFLSHKSTIVPPRQLNDLSVPGCRKRDGKEVGAPLVGTPIGPGWLGMVGWAADIPARTKDARKIESVKRFFTLLTYMLVDKKLVLCMWH